LTGAGIQSIWPQATWFSASLADTLPALGCDSSDPPKLGLLPPSRLCGPAFNEETLERNYEWLREL